MAETDRDEVLEAKMVSGSAMSSNLCDMACLVSIGYADNEATRH